ncbi:MAG TPA: MFS transporter [Jatrophihabitans sp.]|uniref:MFS transporter n=1 Tax=Jatrophihabitans sp. TaxID=1932789 RepID=UPI002E0CF5CF|nr:MFS transporter [Jatrophihabitans sp.]
MTATKVGGVGYRSVFANREFRALWLADGQSSLGDQLSRVALSVLVYNRSGSALLTALVYAVTFLPALLGGVLLGGVADRFPHRTVLVVCNLARAALVASMAFTGMPIAVLVALVFLSTAAAAPFDSANSAMLAVIFEGEQYEIASSVRTITHQLAQVLGFAVGGLALTTLTPRVGLVADAVTFVIAAVVVRSAVRLRPAARIHDDAEPYLRSIAEGVQAIRITPRLRVLLGLAWLMGLLVIPEGLAVPYAATLHASTVGVGLLLAAGPAGTAIGSLLYVKLMSDEQRTRAIGVLATVAGLPLAACVVHPTLAVSVVLWALSGAAGAYLTQLMPQYVRAAPIARRGQAIGIAASGLMAVQGIGILLGGVLAAQTDAALAVAVAGASASALAGVAALRWRRLLAGESHVPVVVAAEPVTALA